MSGVGKLRPEVKAAWLGALRSGEYSQITSNLHVQDGGYCCLGVLCELAVEAGVTTSRVEQGVVRPRAIYGGDSVMPPRSVRAWAFEEEPEEEKEWTVPLEDDDPEGYVRYRGLAEYNDEERFSFAQIADLIEAFL